jgi:anthraniloyl-CoA monooxygenase
MKKADPRHELVVLERNRADDTFGFGVVFSDATLENLAAADPESFAKISESFAHWDDIETFIGGEKHTSTGHGFAGMSRKKLLGILIERAGELGVDLRFETEAGDPEKYRDYDLVLGADGVNSTVRKRYEEHFRPNISQGKNKFVWLGTTFPFDAFTFYFKENEHGMFRVHAYRYEKERSTFIVECTEEAWKKTGLKETDEDATIVYCEKLFAEELRGHRLIKNRSFWRSFPVVYNEKWRHENVVLIGDAAHTAHFSIGSGTKLAMEDSISLAAALAKSPADLSTAVSAYEADRRPTLNSTQRAAEVSQAWFENTERYLPLAPIQFVFSMLTRSLRVTHENLKVRDPVFVENVDRWFAQGAGLDQPRPPMFTPYRLRSMQLENRVVVSPMCQYSAEDGTIDDWHLVHLGSRAIGGAGLVITEMTDVSAEGRITPGCAGLYKQEHVTAWKRVTEFVHRHSSAKIGMQLAHAGRKGATKLPWRGSDVPLEEGSWPLLAPSPLPFYPHSQVPREMNRADMDEVKRDFVRSTAMAAEAGFDMIELHAAHGYLLATFLSPLTNRRTDEYGGSIENRLRYPLEVFEAVRATWPKDQPISVRISAVDWHPDGNDSEDAVVVARAFKALGCDIIDVSAGQTVPEQKPVYGRLFQTPFAERVRIEADMPVMTVGNISSWSDVNSILAAGRADLCVLARAHLFDPYWTRHAANEQGWEMDWPKQYGSVRRYVGRFK